MLNILIVDCSHEIIKFPRPQQDKHHTMISWADCLAKADCKVTLMGAGICNSLLSSGIAFDFHQFDCVLLDSWADHGADMFWNFLTEQYKGLVGCYYHYPSGHRMEDMTREERPPYQKRLSRFNFIFQPNQISVGYYPNAISFPDIIYPTPIKALETDMTRQERRPDVATLTHCYDMSGGCLHFRTHYAMRFLLDMGFKVEYATKQPENKEKFNMHIQEEMGWRNAVCLGWIDDYTSFLSSCALMFEWQVFPSISNALARAAIAGTPVIGTSNPFQDALFPELVVRTQADAAKFVTAVKNQESWIADITVKARERLNRYDIEIEGERILEAIREVKCTVRS